ncbi:MAG: hypothetical protein LBR70_05865 [Lactobacillaceae bacterium]|jgi:sulfur carrier protein ThiS|nr:hypothetical protein [Lactobacillaceae bacterium]
MAVDINILQNHQIKDNEILYGLLQETAFSDREVIVLVETQAYNNLREAGEDVNGLVVVATAEKMLGNRLKAVAIAHNIWDVGGEFEVFAAVAYINLLIDLNLLEMASMLLKPRFEAIEHNVAEFFGVMLKFSIITGNINLIDRLLKYTTRHNPVNILIDFTNVYKRENYTDDYKKIQRIIINNSKDYVCAYDYALYNDRGFTDVEIFIYVSKELSDVDMLYRKIAVEVDNYFLAARKKRIYNLAFTVRKIENHPAAAS